MEDKPRYSRITDILDLLILMQSKVLGVTLHDIQKKFKISRRTAERMRDSVLAILPQIDEIETDSREKHWGFTGSFMNELVHFSNQEVANLEQLKKQLENTAFEDKEKLLDKTITNIKAYRRKEKINIDNSIELLLQTEGFAVKQMPKYKIDLTFLETIREALQNNNKITAVYNGKEKLLCPYGLIYGEKLHFIGVEEEHGTTPYCYLMHKFSDVKLTGEKFDKGDFNLQKFAEQSFGIYHGEIFDVKLLFSKDVAEDVLNYSFHPTQKVKQNEDGTVTVKFKASGSKAIIWHIFKWGNFVKILSPKNLKQEYKEYLEEVIECQKNAKF